MKKFIFLGLLLGCAGIHANRYTYESMLEKTVMLNIRAVVPVVELQFKNNKLEVNKSTATVQLNCSGVMISPTGHILTCAHCIDSADVKDVNVTQWNGDTSKAEILDKDTKKDLALIKINVHNAAYAELVRPNSVFVGDEAVAIGNPLGIDFSVSKGIISAVYRKINGKQDVTQTDASINPGNSGGPLFNIRGELIGINAFIASPISEPVFSGLGFAVSPSQIRLFLDKFKGLEKAVN